MYNYRMTVSKMFINGCSFLTFRPREGVNTHCGIELGKQLNLPIAVNLAGGGRGNKRLSVTTKVWCEKNPEVAKQSFFLIGCSSPPKKLTDCDMDDVPCQRQNGMYCFSGFCWFGKN